MKESITAKAKKELERRFGKLAESMTGYFHHLDFRIFDDFTDDAFAYLMENVTGVNMLDLNETDITNESITLLTNLEYVNELRVKQCRNLTNDCVGDINKLTSLVFLHLGSTNITIDGLLQLNNLCHLKTLLFSAEDVVSIKEKLLQLKTMLPQCDLVINSKPYYFNAIDLFIYAVNKKPFAYRLKIKNQTSTAAWSSRLGQSGDIYIETAFQGPCPIEDIEWLEIDPVEKRAEGELTDVKAFDHPEEIVKLLEYLAFPYLITDGIISTYLINKEI